MLTFLRDNQEHSMKETLAALGIHFNLTDTEMNEMLPSRNQTIFYNKVLGLKLI